MLLRSAWMAPRANTTANRSGGIAAVETTTSMRAIAKHEKPLSVTARFSYKKPFEFLAIVSLSFGCNFQPSPATAPFGNLQSNSAHPRYLASNVLELGNQLNEKQQETTMTRAQTSANSAPKTTNSDSGKHGIENGRHKSTADMKTAGNKSQQSEELAASLRAAANEGKVELVRLLLKCGADLNAQDDEFGNTALHQAAWNGFSETIQVLCKHRANTSIKNKAQFTPLHLACQQGHNQSARLLLMANAKAELKNSYGDTPLHTATRYGHAGAARILLSAKCNPNQVNKNNDTPLHIAAAMGRRKLTKILMQNGAELVIKNKQNETAMDIALRKDLIDIQELIANPPPKNSHHQHHHLRQRSPRPEQRHRHHDRRKSMTNLISAESRGRGISVSSTNVQCAGPSRPRVRHFQRNLVSACDELESPSPVARQQRASSRDFHNIDASRATVDRRTNLTEQLPGRTRDLPTPNERTRVRTLTAGLGVSQAELSAILRDRKRESKLVDEARPRSSSVGSNRGKRQNVAADEKPPQQHVQQLGGPASRQLSASLRPTPRLRSSPCGSMRSSRAGGKLRANRGIVAKTRRLTLGAGNTCQPNGNQQGLIEPQASTTSQRRASTSILSGRLSLMKLRKMVKRRATTARRIAEQADGLKVANDDEETPQESGALRNNLNESSQKESFATETEAAAAAADERRPAIGRRQERIERSMTTNESDATRAPNGKKLIATNPLAPLDDDTQLYAIPKKSSKTTSKQTNPAAKQATSATKDANEATQRGFTHRVAADRGALQRLADHERNNGPALTASDSGQSVASSDSTPDTAAPAAGSRKLDCLISSSSSSDEFIASLAPIDGSRREKERDDRAEEEDDRDLCAPGYSVVRSPKNLKLRQVTGGGNDDEHNNDDHCTSTTAHASLLIRTSQNDCETRQPDDATEACICSLGSHTADRSAQNRDVLRDDNHDEPQQVAANQSNSTRDNNTTDSKNVERRDCWQETADLLTDGDDTGDDNFHDGERLIRPKSVLGCASAELLAAQKSLAAAAAAKVHRDRMAKLARSKQETQSLNDSDGVAAFRELSVKTSATSAANDSSFWLQHHQQHQTLVAAAATRVQLGQGVVMQGCSPKGQTNDKSAAAMEPMLAELASTRQLSRRDGTNSVGMSDSSPSNNGADSDNSIQTQTSGSMNTDNSTTTATTTTTTKTTTMTTRPGQLQLEETKHQQQHMKQAPSSAAAKREQSGPFGILSRILMHNNSAEHAPKRTNNNSNKTTNGLKRIVQNIAGSGGGGGGLEANGKARGGSGGDGATIKTISKPQVSFNGSLSSSSALSSPSISTNGRSPNSTADGSVGLPCLAECHVDGPNANDEAPLKPFDRLGSRSRCPIVLSQSNELPAEHGPSHVAAAAPRLPPKSALKAAREGARYNEELHVGPDALSNGLPRVSSYTQISSAQATAADLSAVQHHNNLCNYHALNRSHMIQTKYSPYLPYALGRYSIHETCDPSSSGRLRVAPHFANGLYHRQQAARSIGSHVNLNSMGCGGRGGGGGGESSSGSSQTITNNHYSPNGGSGGQYMPANESLRNASMVCNYDDSIYIPPYNTYMSSELAPSHNSQRRDSLPHTQANNFGQQHHAVTGSGLGVFSERQMNVAGHNHYQPSPEDLARFNERFITLNNTELLNDYNHQRRVHQSYRDGFVPRPKSSLDSICFMSNGGDPMQDDALKMNLTSQHQQHQALYGQRINAIGASSSGANATSSHSVILKSTGGKIASHAALDRNQLVQCSEMGTPNSDQIETSHLITQNSIYAPSNALERHQNSELTVLPTSHNQTASAPTAREMSPVEPEPVRQESSNTPTNLRSGSTRPPKLPPKTTTLTIGKLTRVSLNSASATNGTVQQTNERRGPAEEELYASRASTLTSC